MLRIIGKYAYEHGEKTGNTDLISIGSCLKDWEIPYRKHINELVELSRMGLRRDRVLSDRIGRIYDGRADKIFEVADGICVDAEE